MIPTTFALLLVAHFLGDVVFTSYRIALLKRSSRLLSQLIGVGGHCGIHALFAGFMLFFCHGSWLKGALLIFFFHFLIDLLRSSVDKHLFGHGRIHVKRSEFVAWVTGKSLNAEKMNMVNLRSWFVINILDQGAHLMSMLCVAFLLG